MRTIFNPAEGAPIHDFIVSGKLLDNHPVGELRRYEDNQAQALLETYEFLQEVSGEQAKQIMGKSPDAPGQTQFECAVDGKIFSHKVALMGHQRSHKGVDFSKLTVAEKPLDLSDIPLAGSKKVLSNLETKQILQNYELNGIKPESETEGVDWYGEGLTEERGSLSRVTPIGQRGHFGA